MLLYLKTEAEPASETSRFKNLEDGQSPKKEIVSMRSFTIVGSSVRNVMGG